MADHPNLLFVFPDQWRGQALGYLGREPVITPVIDQFREQAVELPYAISNNPICSPWRGSFMTGKYSHRNNVPVNCTSVAGEHGLDLPTDARCWSDILHERGYSLGYIGKWHLDNPHKPYIDTANNTDSFAWNEWCPPHRRHGFDHWYAYGTYDWHLRPMYWRGDADRQGFHYVDQWGPEHETDHAIAYLRNEGGQYRDGDKPFALCMSMNPPHMPYDQVPQRYVEQYDHLSLDDLCQAPNIPPAGTKWGDYYRQHIRNYYAACTGVDEQFGRLLATLDELGMADNTVVIFTSDHGDCLGIHDCQSKGVHYEESVRVPLLIRLPGQTAGRSDDLLFSTPDFYPTMLGLLGHADAIPAEVEGVNHADLLRGQPGQRPASQYYMRMTDPAKPLLGERGVRTHTHTLCIRRTADATEQLILHNKAADPYQLRNVAADEPDVVAALTSELQQWMAHTGDPWLASQP